jgi:lysozyme family protein
MRPSFPAAVAFVLAREGGYTLDLNDPGGETRWGISKRSYPKEDIKNLTVDRAKEIYFSDYWMPVCDALPTPADLIVFDTAVNQGKKFAAEMIGECGEDTTAMLFYRLKKYSSIVANRPASGRYLRGWLNRVIELYDFVKEA